MPDGKKLAALSGCSRWSNSPLAAQLVAACWESTKTYFSLLKNWRREWDSNPRYLAVRLISSQVHSTTLPSLRNRAARARRDSSSRVCFKSPAFGASIMGRRDDPEHAHGACARVGAAVDLGAFERETVALVEPEMAARYPSIQRPAEHVSRLRAIVKIVFAVRTRFNGAEQHFQRATEVGRQEFFLNA